MGILRLFEKVEKMVLYCDGDPLGKPYRNYLRCLRLARLHLIGVLVVVRSTHAFSRMPLPNQSGVFGRVKAGWMEQVKGEGKKGRKAHDGCIT